MRTIKISTLTLLFCLLILENTGQNLEPVRQYYDSIYGADHFLINGRIYKFPNHNAEGNPFYNGNDPKTATLMLKGKIYEDLQVNYDIEEDKLILITPVNHIYYYIELNNGLIDSFLISTHFTAVNQTSTNNPLYISNYSGSIASNSITAFFIHLNGKGFFELIYKNEICLVKKYSKKFFDRVSAEKKFGYYSSQNKNLYILKNDSLFDVTKKKDFLNYFQNRKDIKKYIKHQDINFKDPNNKQLIDLMKFCLSKNEFID